MSRARDTANFDPSLLADDEVSLDKLGTSGTLDVSSATLTTSTAQKQAIVQAGPGSGTVDVSSGTFTTSTAQKQTIVQAGPGTGTLDVSSGTLTTSTAQKQAIVQAGPGSGTLDVSSGTLTTSTAQKQAIVQAGPGSGTLDVSSGTFTTSGAQKNAIVAEGGTLGASKTLDVSSGTLTTSTAQKQAIVDGATISSIPSGMIAPMGMSSAPTGWLVCDGSQVSRSTYSALFSAIGTTWGSGDGSSTFHVPDLRGAFLRGTGTAGVNADYVGPTNVGDYQNDQNASHNHSATSSSSSSSSSTANYYVSNSVAGTGYLICGNNPAVFRAGGLTVSTSTSTSTSTSISNSGSTEARVYNRGVQYCIKF